MEGNQEMRHICRFCDKSFSCGRALGGHMRSHLTTNQAESSEKLSKRKSSSRCINDDEKEAQAATQNGYREKPKKTNKFGDLVEGSSFDHDDHINKECGKKLLIWKCHYDNTSLSVEVEDNEYRNSADNEEAAPIRKQRSRIIKRYKDPTITTTSSSCVSEIEQEQEEVALSLILLSRDVTVHWSRGNSIGASSERSNSEFLEARITQPTFSDSKSESNNLKCNDSEFIKSKQVKTEKVEVVSLDSGCLNTKLKQSEYKDTLISINDLEKISAQVQGNGFPQDTSVIENAKMKEGDKIQLHGSELEIKKQKEKKRKSNAIDDSVPSSNEKSDSPVCFVESEKKSKFECTFCNKIFHSYQALGGHRASHKKMKTGCFSSEIESKENNTETEISPIQSTDTKSIVLEKIKITRLSKIKISDYVSKKNTHKVHECPVCFKVFPSGQALGGHKRSHMLAEIKNSNNNNPNETTKDSENVENKKIPEIRDFLDLNLPAPSEQDEVAESSDRVYCNPWWMGIGSNIAANRGFALGCNVGFWTFLLVLISSHNPSAKIH